MRIFITLDYELYLGDKTGTPENCLVRPMNKLCYIADLHHARFIIFVDASYLLRLYQLKEKYHQLAKDYDLVSSHIADLSRKGHDIQMHFHPQWLYSSYDSRGCQWKLRRMPYKLSDMPEDDVFILFHQAKELLDGIIGYKTTAFRAGGYCLSSFPRYKELFEREGIAVDSSVARGMFQDTNIHSYDYRIIPNSIIYHFEEDVCKENLKGRFTELSISSVHWSSLHYLMCVRPRMFSYNPKIVFGDGNSIVDSSHGSNMSPGLSRLEVFLKPYHNLASIDAVRSCQLEHIYNEAKRKGQQDLVLIGHPKAASDVSVKNLELLLDWCKNDSFCTTKDLFR